MTLESRRPDLESRRPAAEPRARLARWYVPVTSCRRTAYRDALYGAHAFLRALRDLWDPMCGVEFVMCMKDGAAAAGFAVGSPDPRRARRAAQDLALAAGAAQPWLGLGEPTRRRPWPAVRQPGIGFLPRSGGDAPAVSDRALPWLAARSAGGTWHLVLALGPSAPAGPEEHRAFRGWPDDPGVNGPGTALYASAALHGPARRADAVASLLCTDESPGGLLSRAGAVGAAPFPLEMLSHLMAAPARLPGAFPELAPARAEELFAALDGVPSPHLLTVGQSGQGKSTLLAAAAARALRRGDALVVVDVHDGDLVRRLAGEHDRAGRPYLFVDWSDPMGGACPVLRVTDPPPGVAPEQHAGDVYSMLRRDLWGAMPEEYFGPVGEAATRAGCELAVFDPERLFGLCDMDRLLDPSDAGFRRATLARIGRPRLTRVVEHQLMPMASMKQDNGAAFVLGKFAPFAEPVARRVMQGESGRVPVEDAIGRGWSLLVHAPTSGLGDDPSRLVVAALLRRVWGAVRRGAGAPRITVVLDEWQKYATGFAAVLLAEGRKYGVSLVLANQNLAQLDPKVRESVLSNVGAVAAFRVGPSDAALLDGLYPTVPVRVLQTLPRHTIALTTFERDLAVPGPAPLPLPAAAQRPFPEALRGFWGGQEPPLREDPEGPPEVPGEQDRAEPEPLGALFGGPGPAPNFLDDYLKRRAGGR